MELVWVNWKGRRDVSGLSCIIVDMEKSDLLYSHFCSFSDSVFYLLLYSTLATPSFRCNSPEVCPLRLRVTSFSLVCLSFL